MTRLANFEKAKQATWITLFAHSCRTLRVGEELLALEKSKADELKLLAQLEELPDESAKVDMFIQKAQESLDDTPKELRMTNAVN